MLNLKKTLKIILTVIIIFALIFPTVLIASDNIPKIYAEEQKTITTNVKDMGEMQIAQEISNMTGAEIKEVLELKGISASWNEVLDKLKNHNLSVNKQNSKYAFLAQSGLDEKFVQELNAKGYRVEEITDVKMLVERVIFQLEEITSMSPLSNRLNESNEEDISEFSELLNKINAETAVYLLLKLKKDFVTNENTLNEYLLSLQIDVDLAKYVMDKDSYEDEKSEKIIGIDINKIITLEKIEQKILEMLNRQKDITTNKIMNGFNQQNATGSTTSQDTPSLPLPEIEMSNPRNPTEDVMDEVNQIKNRSLNIGLIERNN